MADLNLRAVAYGCIALGVGRGAWGTRASAEFARKANYSHNKRPKPSPSLKTTQDRNINVPVTLQSNFAAESRGGY